MSETRGSAFVKFMTWYQKLDKDTIDLLGRFFMKGVSTGDLNGFIKGVLAREMNTPEPPQKIIVTQVDRNS